MSTYHDCRGLAITAGGREAVDAYERAIDAYARISPAIGERVKETMKLDPFMVMANVLKGYFMLLMARADKVDLARKLLEKAKVGVAGVTPREKLHVAALEKWVARDAEGACSIWEQILLEYPRDFVALRLSHYTHFYTGDARRMRDSTARVMPCWDESVPHYSHLLGMRAFGLEETGAYAAAEKFGRRAIELDPDDIWATHAVTHVMEMQDRHEDGLRWLESLRDYWSQANNFQIHLWWHEALLRLDCRDPLDVLAFYDASVHVPDTDESLDMCNFAALLQRLEIQGVDVGDRWNAVAERAAGRAEEGLLVFIDLHFGLSLAAADHEKFHTMREFLAGYEAPETDFSAALIKKLALPMLDAFKAYREGRYSVTRDALTPLRYEWWRVGGSAAQRDLFDQILIDATIKAGDRNLSRALLAERLADKPNDPWTRKIHDKVMALSARMG